MGNICASKDQKPKFDRRNTHIIRNGIRKLTQDRIVSSGMDFKKAKMMSTKNRTSADYGLALIDIKKGNLKDAEKKLAKLVVDEPDNEMFLYTLVKLQFETHKYEESLVNIKALIDLGNEEINTLILAARVYIHASQYKKARMLIKKAYDDNKEREEIFLTYAFVEELLGNHTKAIKLYNEVLTHKLDLNDIYINCKIGYNYIKMGKLKTAEPYIKLIYNQKENHPLVKMLRIFVFFDTQNYKAAMGYIQRYFKENKVYSDVSRSELLFIWALCYRYTTDNHLPKNEKVKMCSLRTLNDESFTVSTESQKPKNLYWFTKGFKPLPNSNLVKANSLKKMQVYSSSLRDLDIRKSIEDLVTMKSHGLDTFSEHFFSQYLLDASAAFPYFFYICRYTLEHFLNENKPMVKELFKIRGKELVRDFNDSHESREFLYSILDCLDNQWEERLALSELIIKLYDQHWDIVFERVHCLVQLRRFDEAKKYFYNQGKGYCNYAGYDYINGLIVELENKNTDEAIQYYEEALKRKLGLKLAFDRLMDLYKQRKDNLNIELLYTKYLTKEDKYFDIKYAYGNFLLENNREEEAYEVFKTIDKNNKDYENVQTKMDSIMKRESYRSLFKSNL